MDTSKRNRKPVSKKDIITSEHVKSLFVMYSDSNDPIVVRDLAMIITCFCGFFRYDDMSNIHCNDVVFEDNFVKFYLRKSKTDQYRQGDEVLLARLDSVACPIKALKKYIEMFSIDLSSSNFFFRALFKTKNKVGLRNKVRTLSYTRVRELIVHRLREVIPVELNIGVHSLRASGVSAAVKAGVDRRVYKKHGRWRSDAVDGYIKDSIESKLVVSKHLGL